MPRIPDEVLDEIRRRVDLQQIVGRHVDLKKAGRSFKGRCPFHNERTPSFNVHPDKGFYYCFGCQASGDAFSFVMEMEGKSFSEAILSLAKECGVEVSFEEESQEQKQKRTIRSQILRINSIATHFFRHAIQQEENPANDYLKERGISSEIAEKFALGFAPDKWDGLLEYLKANQQPLDIAERCGLIIRREKSGHYDRFRNRVVCPIALSSGDICGFSARALSEDIKGAKYINSPESEAYKKSQLLFGMHQALPAMRKTKQAILVEGNFDVISMHQAGFEQTIAPLGTALTTGQLEQLRRLVDEVVLMYDGDNAGIQATLKAVHLLASLEIPTKVVKLPAQTDPDTYLREKGAEKMKDEITSAKAAFEYLLYDRWAPTAGNTEAMAGSVDEAIALLKNVKDRTKRDLMEGQLAGVLNIDRQILVRAAKSAGASREIPAQNVPSKQSGKKLPDPLETQLVAMLVDNPKLCNFATNQGLSELISSPGLRQIFLGLSAGTAISQLLPPHTPPKIVQQLLAGAFKELKDPQESLQNAINHLKHSRSRKVLADLQKQIQLARRRGDTEQERSLAQQIITLRKQIE